MTLRKKIFVFLYAFLAFLIFISILVLVFSEKQPEYVTVTEDRFSYEIKSSWDSYTDDEGKTVYAERTTKDVLYKCSMVMNDYRMSAETTSLALNIATLFPEAEIVDNLSAEKSDPNGVKYKTASAKYTQGKTTLFSYLIFCEEKHLIVIFQGQCKKERHVESTLGTLTKMANSITFIDPPDMLSGRTFKVTPSMGNDTHYMILPADGTFKMCKKLENADTEYVGGTYQVFRGEEALQKVASMEEYGLTVTEQVRTMINSIEFYDQYYAVVFKIDTVVSDGKEEHHDNLTKLYVGTTDDTGACFDFFSCNDIIYEEWIFNT